MTLGHRSNGQKRLGESPPAAMLSRRVPPSAPPGGLQVTLPLCHRSQLVGGLPRKKLLFD